MPLPVGAIAKLGSSIGGMFYKRGPQNWSTRNSLSSMRPEGEGLTRLGQVGLFAGVAKTNEVGQEQRKRRGNLR